MIILIHTSKTMRSSVAISDQFRQPALLPKTRELTRYMQTLSTDQLTRIMHISPSLAATVHDTYATWSDSHTSPAIDSFIGDIYSGLQASTLSKGDREYADSHLRILSGLYGILRPFDGISPYRLELAYRLPNEHYKNLYTFWGDSVAKTLPADGMIINLASVEYGRLVTPFVAVERIVSPKFLTRDPKTGQPAFVVVHAKIARGAFARWLVTSRIDTKSRLTEFTEVGYQYDASLSSPNEPVFVCDTFGGKGLSVRLSSV